MSPSVDVTIPRLAESISEAVLVQWLKQDGETVRVDEPIATLETDKAAVELPAEAAGVLRHARKVGDKVEVGDVIARIEEGAGATVATPAKPALAPATPVAPSAPPRAASVAPRPPGADGHLSPSVRRLVEEHGLDPSAIPASGPGGRLLKEDVQRFVDAGVAPASPALPVAPPPSGPRPAPPASARAPKPALAPSPPAARPEPARRSEAPAPASSATTAEAPAGAPRQTADWAEGETERAVPMSRIRQRIAERLVMAQQTAAILTTFNEVDMTAVMELRARYKESFEQRHGVRLSFMSFFGRACILALQQVPEINAEIRGAEIVYKRHVNLGVAVGTERGLVVPVVKQADQRGFPDLEREIARLAARARDNKLSLDELSGGTFTISNGGVYGSLLSTPILNPPQSGILGMHKIEKRPIALDDQVVIRPMMYLALSYDHRIVDGEQAVTFLVSVKERLEDPERLLVEV
jgi:2-oxoglutarate dehydrogenase E2 component (dihydrolipoamide succinyltransferase)